MERSHGLSVWVDDAGVAQLVESQLPKLVSRVRIRRPPLAPPVSEVRADMNIPCPWKRRLRRRVVIVALVCVDLVLRTEWVERPAARLLEAGIEPATGERAVVGGVDLKPATGT